MRRRSGPLAPVRYAEFQPDAGLRAWVAAFWTLATDVTSPTPRVGTILPDGAVEIVLSFGRPVRRIGTGTPLTRLVVGQLERPTQVGYPRIVDLIGIRLRPAAVRGVLGAPAHTITGRLVALHRVSRHLDAELQRAMDSATSSGERLTRIAGALRAGMASLDARDALVERAVARILSAGGHVRVGALARELGIGGRQLERRFLDAVGLPPKRWANIVRFAAAAATLGSPDSPSLAGVAQRHGYADQAHLTREFSGRAGVPPGRAWWTSSRRRVRSRPAARAAVIMRPK